MIEMLPMDDEESGAELRIINASFADPYLLVLRDDSTVKIYKAINNDEVEEIGAGGLSSTKWLSASLFKSSTLDETFAFLLTPEGGLHVRTNLRELAYNSQAAGILPVQYGQAELRCRGLELSSSNIDL
jgi:cleavage and polyadenylation specificity factor subunit 1